MASAVPYTLGRYKTRQWQASALIRVSVQVIKQAKRKIPLSLLSVFLQKGLFKRWLKLMDFCSVVV